MVVVLSAAKPMLLIRPSKALGPDSHLEMNKGSISIRIASIACTYTVPTSYLMLFDHIESIEMVM